MAALIASGRADTAFGPAIEGVAVDIVFEQRDGRRGTATMHKRPVTIPTVSLTRVFDVDGRKVGYLFFRNFVRPSVAALDEAFAVMAVEGRATTDVPTAQIARESLALAEGLFLQWLRGDTDVDVAAAVRRHVQRFFSVDA